MATLYGNRGYFIIGGAPMSAFAVGENDLLSVFTQYSYMQSSVNGLNYTPSDVAVIPNTKKISLIFEYAFSNSHTPFDFSTLPTPITNVQCLLFSEQNEPLLIMSNLFFRGDSISYPDQSVHAKRSVVFGALDINYFGT